METIVTLIVLTLIGGLMFKLHERRAERLERLNRESWEVLRTTRRIYDETAEAMQALFEEARLKARSTEAREIER